MKRPVSRSDAVGVRLGLELLFLLAVGCGVCSAGDASLAPWLVVSSNRLDAIRQDFYALPRPLFLGWQSVTRPAPVLFFGFKSGMVADKLVLTSNTISFITNSMALATNRVCWQEELSIALWPILLETNYSGDATGVLIGIENNPFGIAGDRFHNTGYLSPTNRGSWDSAGADVRMWLRWNLRRDEWLDVHGMPVAVLGGERPVGSQSGVDISTCTDEAASQ